MRYSILPAALLPLLCAAQWQQVTVPVTANLYSIDSYDAQHLAIGTMSNWLQSTDGGTNWQGQPLIGSVGEQLIGTTFYALEYRNSTELLGVGSSFSDASNPFEVRYTTNSGATWPNYFYAPGSGSLSHFNNMAFNGTAGVVVGDLGRIIRSTNGGSSWTTANSTGQSLFDVAWATATTVVAVGEGRILRSTDSGLTWTTVSTVSGTFRAVSFVSATTGYAAGFSADLLRTTDGGATWQPLGASLSGEMLGFTDLWFTNATEAYGLCGSLIVHSMDGGLHWAWFNAGAEMRQLHFQSPSNGFAVGLGGTLYRTDGSGDYHPWALIDGPSNVCHDSLVTFTSASGPGLSHQWWVNGVAAGTGAALDWTFTVPAQPATVQLVVNNNTWADTVVKTITVAADLTLQVNATINADSVCIGGNTIVHVPASLVGVSYSLYRGSTQQGSTLFGNGSTLSFYTGTISTPQTFHLVGSRNAGSCGTAVDTVSFFVGIGNPEAGLVITPGPVSICQGESLTISIAGTQPEVSYRLRRNNVAIGTAQQGNGGDIAFTIAPPLLTSGTYTIFATNTGNGCTSTLTSSVPVSVIAPQLAWGPTSMNPVVGTPVDLMNSSSVFGGDYLWDIPGGTPATSTEAEPTGVVFTTPGPVAVRLIGTTPQGCRDTLTRVIHAIAPSPAQECGVSQWSINSSNIWDCTVGMDPAGNMFGWVNPEYIRDFVVLSGAGDSLIVKPPTEMNYMTHGFLLKFDTHGVAQWWVDFWNNGEWPEYGDILADADGNIYMAYFHNEYLDSLRIVDASGLRTTIDPPTSGSSTQSVVVTSFTPQGRLRWVRTFLQYYTAETVNMEFDRQGHVLVQSTDHLVQFDKATGEEIWNAYMTFGFRDFSVLPNDHIMVTDRFNMVMREYDNAGILLNTTPPYMLTTAAINGSGLPSSESAVDTAGNIYQLQTIYGGIVINGDSLFSRGVYEYTTHPLYFLTRRNTAGDVLWTRSFEMNSTIRVQGLVVNNERLLLSVFFSEIDDTLHMDGLPDMPFHTGETWLLSVALDGSAPIALPVYAHDGTSLSGDMNGSNAIVLSADGERMAMWASFLQPLTLGNDTAFRYDDYEIPVPSGPLNNGLVFGSLDCILQSLQGTHVPVAWFNQPEGYCAGQDIPFNDASLFGAASWSWDFPGGEPATSPLADPIVSYALPGTYPVTLTTTNANGASTPFTAQVVVDICTGIGGHGLPEWTVWPSPATDEIQVRGPAPAPASLVDLQGRLVWSGQLAAQGKLDVRNVAEGSYILLVGNSRIRIAVAR